MAGELDEALQEVLEETLEKIERLEAKNARLENQLNLMANKKEGSAPEKRQPTRPTFTVNKVEYRWTLAQFIDPATGRKVISEDVSAQDRKDYMERLPHLFEEVKKD